MQRKLLIESDPFEHRIALLEKGVLVEVEIERRRQRSLVGNIYLGKVSRWVDGLQAAFIDIGLERNAYLFVDTEGATRKRAFREALSQEDGEAAMAREPIPIIEQPSYEAGQSVLVQVTRDPLGTKGARVIDQISLPGRWVVYLPSGRGVGISRQIEEAGERERLIDVVNQCGPSEGGVIVRTAGRDRDAATLGAEIAELEATWNSIRESAKSAKPPYRVHADLNLAQRAMRDLFDDSVSRVIVQGRETWELLADGTSEREPEVQDRLQLDESAESLFHRHGIDGQLETLLRRKVWLRSGGYISIDPTEALIAIDVNTGRNVGTSRLEETALVTNLEAAAEVARQIRLRDLGGILVVDFIDMVEASSQAKVLETLGEHLARDRSRVQVSGISEFGLVQMTRKRSKSNLRGLLTSGCPSCRGRGRVKSPQTLALQARREGLRAAGSFRGRTARLRVSPKTAEVMRAIAASTLEEIGEELEAIWEVEADSCLGLEEFELVVADE